MARGDGKAQRGYTRGRGVIKMAAGGNLAARDAAMGGAAVGSRAEATRSTSGGFGGQTARAEPGGGGFGGNEVNRAAKSDRLSPTQLGPGALKEYANQRMAEVFDASGGFRAPQTSSTTLASPKASRGQAMAANRAVSNGQVVNTATKGDLLSTKMPSYAERNKPGAATAFMTLDAAGYGPYLGNKMPNSKAKGSGSASNSFEGFGIDPWGKGRAENIISGQTKQSVGDLPFDGSYHGSLPTAGYSKTSPDQQLAKYVGGAMPGGPRAINTPNVSRGEILASERMVNRATKGDMQQSVNTPAKADRMKPDSGGGSLVSPGSNRGQTMAADRATGGQGAATSTKAPSNVVAGRQNFGPSTGPLGRLPIGGGGEGPRGKKKKPIIEEAVTNVRHGGAIRGDGKAAFGKTKGRFL